jgi:hypothetical protein
MKKIEKSFGEAVDALRAYVAGDYNGSAEDNLKLEELLWDVKLAYYELPRNKEPSIG